MKSFKQCEETGCDNNQIAKGLCSIHYNRKRRESKPNCKQKGCDSKQYASGYCQKHYRQYRAIASRNF